MNIVLIHCFFALLIFYIEYASLEYLTKATDLSILYSYIF